ncbi:MAG: RelA/SpoT family protein [Ignavibacteria bacterium]|nr:RelA/SpoT family protein [Ignavibacteria bacterium]
MLLYPEKKIKEVTFPKYGKGEEADFEAFLEFCQQVGDNINLDLLKKAYEFNINANKNLFRKSGEPFYIHPLEVATFLVQYIMYDNEMVASAILHDVLGKEGRLTLNDIQSEFGNVISQMVDNIHRITNLERKEIGDIEYFRRLILALTTDVRIIFIKIADRLHDMKTISYLSPETQRKFAEDTLQIYVPLAHRFGFYLIKSELEDICFRILDRENYDKIVRKLNMTKKERDEYLKEFAKPIIETLKKMSLLRDKQIKFEVHGRVKHIYSIYNKTLLRGKPVEELYDLIGLRLILDTEDETICEKVIEEIKKIYPFVPETYKDYIKNPKPNGYKSIHCAFIGTGGQKVEVQVRTKKMHLIAEKGFAAHYRYKSGTISMDSVFDDPQIDKWVQDIRDLLAKKEEIPVEKLLESFKYDIFSNEIYVLTPKQELKILPKGSIVLDFAYSIHTDVGNRCAGAKINGKTSSIFTPLKNGDVVEVILGENLEPELAWLEKVVTSKARNSILKYFNQNRSEHQQKGKDFFESLLLEYELERNKNKVLNQCLKILKYPTSNDFFIELSKADELKSIVKLLLKVLKANNFKINPKDFEKDIELKKIWDFTQNRMLLDDKTYEIVFAKCCLPVRGDDAVAYAYGDKIVIHRQDCKSGLLQIGNSVTRKIEFKWDAIDRDLFELGVKLTSLISEHIHILLGQIFQEEKDIYITHIINESFGLGYFVYKFYLRVKDNSLINKMKNIIQTNKLDINIERVGIHS